MNESRLSSVRRIEFAVDWPPGHVACYLLDFDEPVLVDTGAPAEGSPGTPDSSLHQGVREAGYEVPDVEHVVVTHPHVDHVGQVPTLLEEADPTVYAPAGAEERFSRDPDALGERVRENAAAAGIRGEQLEEAVEMAVESLERDAALLRPEAVDVWIEPGPVDVGPLSAEAVHVPGHQADHLCYLTELGGERALFSGDVAMRPFRAVALHDGLDDGVFEAFDAFYEGLDRLADLEVERVYPGHGPVHEAFDATVERDVESLDRQISTVEDLLAEGRRTVPDVAMALAGDRSVRYLVPEAMSALSYLERHDRASVTVEDGVRYYDPT